MLEIWNNLTHDLHKYFWEPRSGGRWWQNPCCEWESGLDAWGVEGQWGLSLLMVADNASSLRVKQTKWRLLRWATEKDRKNDSTDQGRMAVHSRHLRCQRRLRPSCGSGHREDCWPAEGNRSHLSLEVSPTLPAHVKSILACGRANTVEFSHFFWCCECPLKRACYSCKCFVYNCI